MKLASKLVGWHIEVRAEGQVEDALKRAEGLFAKKPEELPAETPPPEGESPAVAPPAEGEAVVAEAGEPSEAPPAEGMPSEAPAEASDEGAKEGTDVEEKAGEPTKE